jgi:hypothetical protein
MSLIGTPASYVFDVSRRVMILNVRPALANHAFVKLWVAANGMGEVNEIIVYGPFENGFMRVETSIKWFDTETARIWQGTVVDPALKAQISVTLTDAWVLIPLPIDNTINNKLWQEDMGIKTPLWYTDSHPETDVLCLESISNSTRAAATLLLTDTYTNDYVQATHASKYDFSKKERIDHIALTMY